ncbi:hypothetical protein C7293_00205 [filamentous cyanobacterium CCT1]|nr:hypothetical protein C7293_00205 [filamentous cyanobacterium CCT1]PSN81463.1 hypothetical protein C8B47_01145 [filamentous cyanobacterium CCP4]
MLLEDCQKMSQHAQDIGFLKKYATDLGKFRNREDQIQALVKELSPLVIALQAFNAKGINKFTVDQKADQFSKEILATLSKFSEDKGFLVGEEFKIAALNSKFKVLKDSLEVELSQAWHTYKKEELPTTNRELLDLLEKISTFRPTVQKVKSILMRLENIRFPANENQFKQVDDFISELSDAWDSLKSNEVPESVLNFLKATSTVGASLDSLTPEVEAWLRDKGITRLFQIKLAD